MTEQARIEFLIARDGLDGAIKWARRTAGLYRKALLHEGHYAGNREFRKLFIQSYLELKRFAQTREY